MIVIAACLVAPSTSHAELPLAKFCIETFSGVAKKIREFKDSKNSEKKFAAQLANYEHGLTLFAVSKNDFNSAWAVTTRHDLKLEEKYFRQLIKERDPQIEFLRELGFKFDYVNGHTIPSMTEMNAKYLAKMDALVESGKIRADQVLKPVRFFKITENGKTRIITVGIAEEPPSGAVVLDRVATGEEFLRVIADGHWPIGEIRRADEGHVSIAMHDFGHFGGFARSPEFMAAVSDFAKARVASGNFETQRGLLSIVFEVLSLGKREARPELVNTFDRLGAKVSSNTQASPLEYYEGAVSKVAMAKVDEEIASAYNVRNKMTDDIGGLLAEGMGKVRTRDIDRAGQINAPEHLGRTALLENPRAFLEKAYDSKSEKDRRFYFAKYLAAMDHTTRMEPATWIRELNKSETYAPSSPIYNYVCRSGIFTRGHAFYESICPH